MRHRKEEGEKKKHRELHATKDPEADGPQGVRLSSAWEELDTLERHNRRNGLQSEASSLITTHFNSMGAEISKPSNSGEAMCSVIGVANVDIEISKPSHSSEAMYSKPGGNAVAPSTMDKRYKKI